VPRRPAGLLRLRALGVLHQLDAAPPREPVDHREPVPPIEFGFHVGVDVAALPLNQVHLAVPALVQGLAPLLPLVRDVLRHLQDRLLLEEGVGGSSADPDGGFHEMVVRGIPPHRHPALRVHQLRPHVLHHVLGGHDVLPRAVLLAVQPQLALGAGFQLFVLPAAPQISREHPWDRLGVRDLLADAPGLLERPGDDVVRREFSVELDVLDHPVDVGSRELVAPEEFERHGL